MSKQKVIYRDLGSIDYKEAWDLQTELNALLIQDKRRPGADSGELPHYLLMCAHSPVYTLGRSGSEDNLKVSAGELDSINAKYYKINRGGDITFHGPGQVVGYPILDLDRFFTDVHKYVRLIEEGIIRLLAKYDLQGRRLEGFTGVWLNDDEGWRKICAIGVHLKRWVTMHGFALNVNTDLGYFENIIPCGIEAPDKSVTSMAKELGSEVDVEHVKQHLKDIFAELFEFEYLHETS